MANPRAVIETSVGTITVELYPEQAPITVANFRKYAEEGFYTGTIFHRVIKGFVIQGGGLEASGRQKPTHPPIKLEIAKDLKHKDGALSMARTSIPNSATAQFYICDGPQRSLDGQYAVFGQVVEGMDVVKKIATTPTDRNERPRTDVTIKGVKIQ